mmetsp:Transcript_13276/g.33128  ORF Transcript_13276/g.33128 Transcript_13276/m.33128 type:complete len:212 (+) Transcript_13276:656-1291(+)
MSWWVFSWCACRSCGAIFRFTWSSAVLSHVSSSAQAAVIRFVVATLSAVDTSALIAATFFACAAAAAFAAAAAAFFAFSAGDSGGGAFTASTASSSPPPPPPPPPSAPPPSAASASGGLQSASTASFTFTSCTRKWFWPYHSSWSHISIRESSGYFSISAFIGWKSEMAPRNWMSSRKNAFVTITYGLSSVTSSRGLDPNFSCEVGPRKTG